MSLQILQNPLKSFAEETSTLESDFEHGHDPLEMEIPERVSREWASCPSPASLESEILAGTHQQIRNLKVQCDHSGITVYGVSASYYLKQLVTQCVKTLAPSVPLMNRVLVNAK
ncbi:MAG: hypothetical protein K0U86_15115 [Planctomycetes bacterium]|nr:hypothetical protein [Planctomycetota bacterium]MCH9726228.1 hypothetical protein [Planctomycetota bacterium]MCH9775733.1 hypothetical protein [Planctomycetota bacterium]